MKKSMKGLIFSLKERYYYYLVSKAWKERHNLVKAAIANYRKSSLANQYKAKWGVLNHNINTDTLDVCYSISNREDLNYVPEEIFESVIEKKLNKNAPIFVQHKSFYNRIFLNKGFITDLCHKVGGVFYNATYDRVSIEEFKRAAQLFEYPVILKKSIETAGGRDINFANSYKELVKIIELYDDFVVQPVIKPHPYFREFHDFGLNTVRACLYRSVMTNQIHLLNTTLRLGRDGHLDNETQGGLVCNLSETGELNDYVVDKYGVKLNEHPNSGVVFSNHPAIPKYEELVRMSIEAAEAVPYAHLISLDLAMDEHGDWKLIEVNLEYQTIRFAQYAGKSFFGAFTNEVIGYCK